MPDRAKEKRNLAAQARRWAKGLSPTDKDHLEWLAGELEKEAAEFERQAAASKDDDHKR